jgi:hypothetical protein
MINLRPIFVVWVFLCALLAVIRWRNCIPSDISLNVDTVVIISFFTSALSALYISYSNNSLITRAVKKKRHKLKPKNKNEYENENKSKSNNKTYVVGIHNDTNSAAKMRVGIIGFGPMGKYLADLLSRNGHHVACANRRDAYFDDSNISYKLYALDELDQFCSEQLDIIIIAVSISSIEGVLSSIPSFVFENKLVIDICSVKVIYYLFAARIIPYK